MKNIIISSLFIATLISCKKEVLNLSPISEIGSNEFYTNAQQVEQATIAIYDGMQAVPLREFALTEMRSDNTRTKTSEGDWAQFESFTVKPTNQQVANYWAVNYNVIFRANRVLENLGVVSGSLRNQLEGEAKFARALSHFNLVRAYGGVPILDKVIVVGEDEYYARDTEAEVLSFIAQDLEDAVFLLPTKGGMVFGRATSEAAQALLAKVYLTQHNYSDAKYLLEGLLANLSYSLMPEYSDVFYKEANSEIIFAIPYKNDDLYESQDFSFEMTNGGVASGLNYLTNDFLSNLDPMDTERIAALQNPLNPVEVGKFLSSSLNARLCGNDWIVLRLADVYLMHVEAVMAGQATSQNLDAIASYNTIRTRVGLSTIPTDGTGEITLAMLLKERRYELAFENHRFYDLVRTGQAQIVLSAFAASEGNSFTSTDLLLPIPLKEINVSNGLLKQNPGY